MQEKRVCPRLATENGIAVRVITEGVESPTSTESAFLRLTNNISKSGLQFNHSTPLAENTTLCIHLALDMPRKFVTHIGEVRWNNVPDNDTPCAIGVEFTKTEFGDMEAWEEYVEARLDQIA